MKVLSVSASVMALGSSVTKEDWLFILGVAVTVINIMIEYLKSRKKAPT